MKKVTFLGPYGATFSHDAYNALAEMYGAPSATLENYCGASHNREILRIIQGHGGYGAIAMETLAEGRVAEPLESFIELLSTASDTRGGQLKVVGAIRLRIHFCLMTRVGVSVSDIDGVVGHPKALGACKGRLSTRDLKTVGASSNGEAARLVAESAEYQNYAALGPLSAAQKYSLHIHHGAYEDDETVTTFFLIAPPSDSVSVGATNRALIVFRLPHVVGALARALAPFAAEGLSLIQIHSIHTKGNAYDFAIEIEVSGEQVEHFDRAMKAFARCADRHISFGPFEILSK